MYLDFFKLREFPFRLTPDTTFLYMSEAHVRAKAYMAYTVWNRDGFVVISGEIGSGKTTLIQKLISELDDNVIVAKVFQTQLTEVEFLQSVLVEFGLNPFSAQKVQLIDMLNSFLIEQFHKDMQLVLIVDDAHNLSPKVLEEIRMLSGLETQKEKLLHIILVGQPQLNELLESAEMEQLLQRVRLRYHIKPLSEDETRAYITHRLGVAGLDDANLFTPDTISTIYEYTGGLPRLINTLCDTCLVCAYADRALKVTKAVLQGAIEELQWVPYAKRVRKRQEKGKHVASEYGEMLQQNTRALVGVGNQLANLEGLAPALHTVSQRMNHIEALLQEIATTLRDGRPVKDNVKKLMKAD